MKFKERLAISLLVFVSATLFLALFFVTPLLEQIARNFKEFARKNQEAALLQQKVEDTISFQKFYKENINDFEKVQAMFIDSEDPLEFIEFLEKTADSLALELDISVANGASFDLKIRGAFPDLLKFLLKIESSPYLIRENGLSISRLGKDNLFGLAEGEVSATLKIKAEEN